MLNATANHRRTVGDMAPSPARTQTTVAAPARSITRHFGIPVETVSYAPRSVLVYLGTRSPTTRFVVLGRHIRPPGLPRDRWLELTIYGRTPARFHRSHGIDGNPHRRGPFGHLSSDLRSTACVLVGWRARRR